MLIGRRKVHWVPIGELKEIELCPTNVAELMERQEPGVRHFIYRE